MTTDDGTFQPDLSSIRDRSLILGDLSGLTAEPGFVYALAWLTRKHAFGDVEALAQWDHHEHLSFQELQLLSGLLLRNPIDTTHIPDQAQFDSQVGRAESLLEELHESYALPMAALAASGSPDPTTLNPLASGDSMVETIFYAGTGGFDFQYLDLASERYAPDQEWLLAHMGFDMAQAVEITHQIRAHFNLVPLPEPTHNWRESLETILESCCFRPDHLPQPRVLIDAYLDAFSCDPGRVNAGYESPDAYNQFDSHPIIRLSGDRFFLPVPFRLAVSLYESPFYWMLGDAHYKDRAAENRGAATESIAARMLASVFGERKVFIGVDLVEGGKVVGEIDVLAVLGDHALIVQCKSKKLTQLARTGDASSLAADFEAAVQAAYDQGLSCRALVLEQNGVTFQQDGKTLVLAEHPKHVALMCVVADRYPALTHQAHFFLKRPPGECPPLTASLLDLEIITHYLSDPYEFLHYHRQRTQLAHLFRADEEIALLAFYLQGLLVQQPGFDLAIVPNGMALPIDTDYPAARGLMPLPEGAHSARARSENPTFDRAVDCFRSGGHVDAVLSLLSFSSDARRQFVAQVVDIRRATERDSRIHSVSLPIEGIGSGITYVSLPNGITESGMAMARQRAGVSKYLHKGKSWMLVVGSRTGDPVDRVDFDNESWESTSPELRDLASRASGTRRMVGKKLGRNDPCWCRSGLKYKKCHGQGTPRQPGPDVVPPR